jgi:hypothetical protein
MNPLQFLEQRVAVLGNHYQKYLFTIQKYKEGLLKTLTDSGKLMRIHLWSSSFSPSEEMKIIKDLSKDKTTNIQNLSCYYALQSLYMNLRNLDILELGIASGDNLTDVYYQFMVQIGIDFRQLTKAYLENLLEIYLPCKKQPEFCVCSVGARSDQDDIDIAIITADNTDVHLLNNVFIKIRQNMLVYATPLHMYLSEHVGKQLYTTTISEYNNLLNKRIQNVVIISELLNARIIFGSNALFTKLQQEVISRYFYRSKKDIRFHEGFLRGILGETRSLLISPLKADAITPKNDAIRMLKFLLYAKKTIYNLEEVNPWDIILALLDKEPQHTSRYEFIFKAISFLEMIKFLLQMYIVQEDTFILGDISPARLSMIAEKMGYHSVGTVSPWDQLIIDYYVYVKEVKKFCDTLVSEVSDHLSSITIFKEKLLSYKVYDTQTKHKGSLAKDFFYSARFFQGTKYWEDILVLLESDKKLLDTFIKGFEKLNNIDRKKLINYYLKWTHYSLITLIRLITIIGKRQVNELGYTVFRQFNQTFLKYIEKLPVTAERLYRIFSYYPKYIHEYLHFLPDSHYKYLNRILNQPVVHDNLKVYKIQFKYLCNIHKWSSQYFHRFFYRVIANNPEYLISLTNLSQLSKISAGLLAKVDIHPDYSMKKKILGNYYDLEFLRIGIGTMRGTDIITTNNEFIEFCDQYTKKLFDICAEEEERKNPKNLFSTDTFAILAAGGHARGQAYDDDYDLIAVIDTEDPEVMKHITSVITHMNRQIVKRGLIPHYRLGEILGAFVNPLSHIMRYLASDNKESFIDLSQILGSRLIIGSEVMKKNIDNKILNKFVFQKKRNYITQMIHEIHNRQKLMNKYNKNEYNLKETAGGLRDIEAVALILKAKLEIIRPITQNFFQETSTLLPVLSEELAILHKVFYFLSTIRNIYRITESSEDHIQKDYLSRISIVFKKVTGLKKGNPEFIINQIRENLVKSIQSRDHIINYLQNNM